MQGVNPLNSIITPDNSDLSQVIQDGIETAREAQLQARKNAENGDRQSIYQDAPKTLQSLSSSGSPRVELDKPAMSSIDGGFYAVLILALSNLSEIMGGLAETVKSELGQKRVEMKALLTKKLRESKEAEERKQAAIEAEKAMEAAKNKKSLFGRIMGFVFPAIEIITGIATTVVGAISFQPSLIAGGLALTSAGVLETTAEIINMTGGNAEKEAALRGAATGLLVTGIVLSSYGAGSAAAGAVVAAKKGVQEGTEAAAKKGLLSSMKKSIGNRLYGPASKVDQTVSNTMKKALNAISGKQGKVTQKVFEDSVIKASKNSAAKIESNVRDIAVNMFNKLPNKASQLQREQAEQMAQQAIKEALLKSAKAASKKADDAHKHADDLMRTAPLDVGSQAAAKGAARIAEANAQEAWKQVSKHAAGEAAEAGREKIAKEAHRQVMETASKRMDKIASRLGTTALVASSANSSYKGWLKMELAEDQRMMAELEKQIEDLVAELELTVKKQELVNQLIELLHEFISQAVVQPVNESLKIINEIIQDRGNTARRIAATHSV